MGANTASASHAGVKIAIVMGSKSDWATMQFAAEVLTMLDVRFHAEVVSAHRTPDKLFSFAEQASANGFEVIIAGAGGCALAGHVGGENPGSSTGCASAKRRVKRH